MPAYSYGNSRWLRQILGSLGIEPESVLERKLSEDIRKAQEAQKAVIELPSDIGAAVKSGWEALAKAPQYRGEMGPPYTPPLPTTGKNDFITGSAPDVPPVTEPTSRLEWNWSDTGTTEPRPEEGQRWLQRAGAGTPFPQPLSNAELSEASYQFPNAPHIQEAWGVRKAEDLAAATRTQQALNALREAETETSPLVSGLRERQARQKAYPSQEQALGMIGQAEIAGRYGEERANITAQALLQRAMLTAISQGDLASARRYQSLITARARIASLPQDEESKKALAFIDAQIMNEVGPQLFSGGEDMGDYDDALEGLLESFR